MKPTLRLCTLIVALCAVASSLGSDLERGDRLLAEGRLDEALLAWDAYKQEHPRKLTAYLRTAQALIDAGRQHDASAELRDALACRPTAADEAVELARAVAEVGNVGIAVGILEAEQKKAALGTAATWYLADLYYRQRRFDEALGALDRYARLPGADPQQLELRRGMILLEKGALEDSMSAFEQVVRRNPQLAAGFHGLSKVCLYGNNPEAALSMSREAVRLEPDNGIYLFQLGVVLKAVGQTDEAIRRLEEAEAKGGDAFGISFELGDAFRRSGQTERARHTLSRYQSMLEERRAQQEVLQLESQGREQLQKEDMAGATETFLRLAERSPESWTARESLAKLYFSQGAPQKAWAQVEAMLRLDPSSSEAHFLAALYWSASGDPAKALREAREARRLRPGSPPLRNLLGNLYFAGGDWRSAVDEYRAAAALDPDNAAFQANLESAQRRLGGTP